MKTTPYRKPLGDALGLLSTVVLAAALWNLPGRANGQGLYVGNGAGSGIAYIGEYDVNTGSAINSNIVSNLTGNPTSLALWNNGLFVTNSNGTTVGEYDATTGATINANFITGLTSPRGLLVSGNTLFVSSGTSTVGTYDVTTGAAINANLIASGLNSPEGLALSGNNLFVASFNSNAIAEFDATTGAALNLTYITGLNKPAGLALSGNALYEANSNGNTVGKYDILLQSGTPNFIASPGKSPWGLAVAGNSLFVANIHSTIGPSTPVSEYDAASGAPINSSFIIGLTSPSGIVIAPEPGSAAMLLLGAGTLLVRRRRSA